MSCFFQCHSVQVEISANMRPKPGLVEGVLIASNRGSSRRAVGAELKKCSTTESGHKDGRFLGTAFINRKGGEEREDGNEGESVDQKLFCIVGCRKGRRTSGRPLRLS